MNIFFVHQDPKIAAQMLANAHVRSQIKESVLMLAAAHHIFGDDKSEHVINSIELTHQHHPSTVWTRHSHGNYQWLLSHLWGLLDEYRHRHGVPHYRLEHAMILGRAPECPLMEEALTVPPAVVSPELKPETPSWPSVVEAYRKYYLTKKRHLHLWMVRPKPDWIP
jgi:hypothetical protein